MSDVSPRLIRAAAENAYVLTRPTLARRDAPVPKLRSRLVKILSVPHPGKELFRQLRVGRVKMLRLRCSLACDLAWEEARASATGRVGEKGGLFEQPIGPRMQNQDKEGNFV